VREGVEPSVLSREQQVDAFPTDQLPANVASNARALGFEITPEMWSSLDCDERYALMKLGGKQRGKRDFGSALSEFFPNPRTSSAAISHVRKPGKN
jgi:hypothetical protein